MCNGERLIEQYVCEEQDTSDTCDNWNHTAWANDNWSDSHRP